MKANVEIVLYSSNSLIYLCSMCTSLQMGFWDPRSDDDQLQVTCMQFQEEQLVVGLQGGMALLFQISKQSSNITIQVWSKTRV